MAHARATSLAELGPQRSRRGRAAGRVRPGRAHRRARVHLRPAARWSTARWPPPARSAPRSPPRRPRSSPDLRAERAGRGRSRASVASTEVSPVVKVVGFVASAPGLHRPARRGQRRQRAARRRSSATPGVHARSAVGVAVLPLDAPVEVELVGRDRLKRGADRGRDPQAGRHCRSAPPGSVRAGFRGLPPAACSDDGLRRRHDRFPGRRVRPRGRGLRATAVREVREETGIELDPTLCCPGRGGSRPKASHAAMTPGSSSLCCRRAWSRSPSAPKWITSNGSGRLPPLPLCARGELQMWAPTLVTLRELADCADIGAVLATVPLRQFEPVRPKLIQQPDGGTVVRAPDRRGISAWLSIVGGPAADPGPSPGACSRPTQAR